MSKWNVYIGEKSFRFFKRTFVWPFLISFKTEPSSFGGEYPFRLTIGKWCVGIPKISRTGGTCRTTTYMIQFFKDKRIAYEISFCWRPDVTHHYWIREPRYRRLREIFHD